jgi:hypothetical protein
MPRKFTKLKQLLALIGYAAYGQEKTTVANIIKVIGSRSFGPLLLLIGIILFSPLSGIPGMPTAMGVFLLLIALQLLFGRKYFWLPDWLLKRSVTRTKLNKSLKWLRPVSSFVDRFLEPRLTVFIHGPGLYAIALICTVIAVCLPIMELIPFSASTAGAVLTFFGLSLISDDGLLALIAFGLTGFMVGTITYTLL